MSYSVLKTSRLVTHRPYIANIAPANRRDPQIKFEMVPDRLDAGIFRAKLGAYFSGTFAATLPDQQGAPPAIYLDADVAMHGLQKTYKLVVEYRPEGRPPLASEPAAGDGVWPIYVNSAASVESLIAPGNNNSEYEPASFYTHEMNVFGYYVDIDVFVNISETKSLYLKWGSAVDGKFASFHGASLQLTKIQ